MQEMDNFILIYKIKYMFTGVIYLALSPSGKKYYGKSCRSMEVRKSSHLKEANTTNKQTYFLTALRKYGDDFVWSVVETLTAPSREELRSLLNEREKFWIFTDKTSDKNFGYNMTSGGDGGASFGRKVSEETKQKIAASLKGKKHTDERRKNMSDANKGVSRPKGPDFIPWCKGQNLSDDIKQKISDAKKGKSFSNEHCKNLSESHKGQTPWNKGMKKGRI